MLRHNCGHRQLHKRGPAVCYCLQLWAAIQKKQIQFCCLVVCRRNNLSKNSQRCWIERGQKDLLCGCVYIGVCGFGWNGRPKWRERAVVICKCWMELTGPKRGTHVLIFVHVLICISNVVGALVCLQGDIVEIQLHSVLENIDRGF